MTRASNYLSRATVTQPRRFAALTASALICGLACVTACSDDDGDSTGTAGKGGSAGSAGAGGGAGSAGSGSAGSGGAGGSAGSAGSSGSAGTAGAGGNANAGGPTGTISVLSSDALLRGPTTAAIRGTDLWVVNGQLNTLSGTPATVLPFNVVSLPLAGGAIGNTITLPGNNFFPEGIAAATDGRLYVGSVSVGTIVRIPATSTTPDTDPFVADTVSERGVIGLTVDEGAGRGLLWFCDSTPPPGAPGGDLVGVDLDDGTEVVRHALPNPGSVTDAGADAAADSGDAGAPASVATFCNDVVVAQNGNIFVTDSSGRIFRILAADARTANSADVWLSDPEIAPAQPGGFGANGIDIVGGQLIIASGDHLVAVDPNSNTPASSVRHINLTEAGAAATLCGPDGLQAVPNSTTDLIVVENGSCSATPDRDRVVRVTLDLTP